EMIWRLEFRRVLFRSHVVGGAGVTMRSFRTIMRMTATLLAGAAVVCVFVYAVLLVAGFKPVEVYSGSMVPTLRVGSIAFDRPVSGRSVRAGDVITFQDPYTKGRLVTH